MFRHLSACSCHEPLVNSKPVKSNSKLSPFHGIPGQTTFLWTISQRQRIKIVISKEAANSSKVWITNVKIRSQWRNNAWAPSSYCTLNIWESGYLPTCQTAPGKGPELCLTLSHRFRPLASPLLQFCPRKGDIFLNKCLSTGHWQAEVGTFPDTPLLL